MREGRFSEASSMGLSMISSGGMSPGLLRAFAEALWGEGRIREALRAAGLAMKLPGGDSRAALIFAQLCLASGRKCSGPGFPAVPRGAGPGGTPEIYSGLVKRYSVSADIPALLGKFRRLFGAGKFPEAVKLAEALLNFRAPVGNEVLSVLSAPLTTHSVAYPAARFSALLRSLCAANIPKELNLWRLYYLNYLANVPVSGGGKAWKALRLRALKAGRMPFSMGNARYGWMFKQTGRSMLFSVPPDYGGAREAFSLALASPPPEGDAFGRMAEVELCLGRETAAMTWLERGMKACPDQAMELMAWRGELKLFTGDYRGALSDLEKALSGNAYYAATWLALALLKTGRTQKALAMAESAVRRNPMDGEALVVRGEIRCAAGDFAGAGCDLRKALRGGFPYCHELWAGLNLLRLNLLAGKPVAALQTLRTMRRLIRGAGPAEEVCRGLSDSAGSPAGLLSAVERLFLMARGCRRDEAYLFPVWMGRRVPSKRARTQYRGPSTVD